MEFMKHRKTVIGILLGIVVLLLAVYRIAFFQSAKDKVLALLQANERLFVKGDTEKISSRDMLQKYYNIFGYNESWTAPDTSKAVYREMLRDMLRHADSLGLNPSDYHSDFIAGYDSQSRLPGFNYAHFQQESELVFADAAISFLFHVAYGREIKTEYDGVKYLVDTARIMQAYHSILATRHWRGVLDTLEPGIYQYLILKERLNSMKAFLRDFPEVDTMTVTDNAKLTAALKLRFYGVITDSLAEDSTGMLKLSNAIKDFQQMMSLDVTGKTDAQTIALLNEPLERRIAQVKESLNYWRWTGRLKEKEFILVNIPSARLQVVNHDTARDLSMKVIVGKQETQTPSFTAYISKVIAYPYWNVPFSIATKEMLPKIKKNVGYLDANNLQVLNGKGEVVDPYAIKWSKFSQKYFPYRIRQSTGCDNALGVLKFDLNSPFSIYLHDTNARNLFGKGNRFLSHGCIRIEKPMELANYILTDGLDSATTAKLNQCLKDEKPTEFKLKKNFPVLILYMTADIDASGLLKFYNDVYRKEGKLAA